MRRRAVLLGVALGLAVPVAGAADPAQQHNGRCVALGYLPDTPDFANCLLEQTLNRTGQNGAAPLLQTSDHAGPGAAHATPKREKTAQPGQGHHGGKGHNQGHAKGGSSSAAGVARPPKAATSALAKAGQGGKPRGHHGHTAAGVPGISAPVAALAALPETPAAVAPGDGAAEPSGAPGRADISPAACETLRKTNPQAVCN